MISDLAQLSSRYTPIPKAEFRQLVFQNIYSSGSPLYDRSLPDHGLAIMFLVLALGTLMDPTKEARNKESLYWYNLGRASLSLETILEKHSMSGIQAMVGDVWASRRLRIC